MPDTSNAPNWWRRDALSRDFRALGLDVYGVPFLKMGGDVGVQLGCEEIRNFDHGVVEHRRGDCRKVEFRRDEPGFCKTVETFVSSGSRLREIRKRKRSACK